MFRDVLGGLPRGREVWVAVSRISVKFAGLYENFLPRVGFFGF